MTVQDDERGATPTPGGAMVRFTAVRVKGPGFYYDLPATTEIRNWGPFPTRDIAERWHESPGTITDDDIAAIRAAQGYG